MLSEVNYRNQIEKFIHNTGMLEECVVMKDRVLYEAHNKTIALCAVISSNLEMTLSKSIHRLHKQSSMAAPCERGAPSNVE